ncbi:MAG: RsmB/NOP family class I SAM-dependent RNA methyltransferase [Lachnospiraceae bacterium]|nr:RsmB/NOP family class I SAM-dependent RNA methyltransferase [Lachnospiraceae bacterium]
MKTYLSLDEYEAFLASYEETNKSGLRLNTLKIGNEEWEKIAPFSVEKISFIENGYFYEDNERPSKHPFYYAGLYYLQEPSAMLPAKALPVEEGDRILDLCAAPGGKSTELAARLKGTGVLVSNDISNSRAKALLKNIELFGVRNAVVISEDPAKLAKTFKGWFDKILVDAPCSGEGMFRKQPGIIKNWEQYGTEYYHKLQQEILPHAVEMLKPGGYLVYSTCTFSAEEDEGMISELIEKYPLTVEKIALENEGFDHGRPEWGNGDESISNTIRLWPHRIKGEGHFCALLKKNEDNSVVKSVCNVAYAENSYKGKASKKKDRNENPGRKKLQPETMQFFDKLGFKIPLERLEMRDGRIYLLPEDLPDLKGLRILRSGLLLGEEKTGRFEPSEALAMSLKTDEFDNVLKLEVNSQDVLKYLKGETITGEYGIKQGYCLVTVEGFPLGFGKATLSGSMVTIKNKILPGWRMM